MSHQVFLSIGTNINREQNLRSAIDALREIFGGLEISPVYESAAVGFDGDPFYNCIVAIKTEMGLTEINQQLKKLEDAHGRERQGPKFSSRTLDIDVVTFDEVVGTLEGIELPRAELYYNAFVLLPMADLLGDLPEPKTGRSYRSLIDSLPERQQIERIDFHF